MKRLRSQSDRYEAACQLLDAMLGYPDEATKTLRALPLAADLFSDADGRVYFSISDGDVPDQWLADAIASGAAEEITEEEYLAAIPRRDP